MNNAVHTTINEWHQMTNDVLNLKEISPNRTQQLLQQTRLVIASYAKETLVPKAVVKLFGEMDEFLYFASMMEDNEVRMDFYHYQDISCEVKAIKETFYAFGYNHT